MRVKQGSGDDFNCEPNTRNDICSTGYAVPLWNNQIIVVTNVPGLVIPTSCLVKEKKCELIDWMVSPNGKGTVLLLLLQHIPSAEPVSLLRVKAFPSSFNVTLVDAPTGFSALSEFAAAFTTLAVSQLNSINVPVLSAFLEKLGLDAKQHPGSRAGYMERRGDDLLLDVVVHENSLPIWLIGYSNSKLLIILPLEINLSAVDRRGYCLARLSARILNADAEPYSEFDTLLIVSARGFERVGVAVQHESVGST